MLLLFQIGSTEWVEQNLENLGSKGVAYLNVDCVVQGPGFFARATPQPDSVLVEKKVKQFKIALLVYSESDMLVSRGLTTGGKQCVEEDGAF